jgi:DNA processing protein
VTVRDLVASSLLPPGRRRTAALAAALVADADGRPLPLSATLDQLAREVAPDSGRDSAFVARLRSDADTHITRASASGLQLIGWVDPRYPPALRLIPDPPPVLWVRGDPDLLNGRLVAVVGSRAASSYGVSVAKQLGHDLARAGVVVVSGLARGCDGAAHRGALDAGGSTVAVLGCGADIVYPREHRPLADGIVKAGAVVSELVPGTPPLPVHFPLRNRIISGLSAALVVVEASSRSGSLITVGCALEQGREVMAVPGNILSDRHAGCHALLRDGACLVQSAGDVLEALGWTRNGPAKPGGARDASQKAGAGPGGSPDSAGLLRFLAPGEEVDLDTLRERSGRKTADLLTELTILELNGFVDRLGGGRFMRSGR